MGHVEYLKYFGSTTTNDTICTREITPGIVTAKAVFNEKKTIYINKLDLYVRKKLLVCYT